MKMYNIAVALVLTFFTITSTAEVQIKYDNNAYQNTNGEIEEKRSASFYKDGKLHRIDGPARIDKYGNKEWFINGMLHNTNGPALVTKAGTKAWFINGRLHNTNGPAIIYKDGNKAWFINGKRIKQPKQQTRHSS